TRRGTRCGTLVNIKTTLGIVSGAAARLLVAFAARGFFSFARGGFKTFAFAARVDVGKALGFFLGAFAVVVLARAGAVQRQSAGLFFFFRQRAQHDAGAVGTRGGTRGACRRRARRCCGRRCGSSRRRFGRRLFFCLGNNR